MNVYANLVIFTIDFTNNKYQVLLHLENIISKNIRRNHTIEDELRTLISNYIDTQTDWIKFNLVDVIKNDNELEIYFVCVIPNTLRIKKGKWYEIGEIPNQHDIQEIIFKASQKIY